MTSTYETIGRGYEEAAAHLVSLNLSSLSRDEFATMLKRDIFPNGRASEDWQDNALEVFDKLVAVLSEKSIDSKGGQTQRLLKLGHTPGIKPRGDIIHD